MNIYESVHDRMSECIWTGKQSVCTSLQHFKNTHWAGVHVFICHRLSCITGSIPKVTRQINDYWYLVITSSGLSTATDCIMGCLAVDHCVLNVFWKLLIPVFRWGNTSTDDLGWKADLSGWGSRCWPPHSHTAKQAGKWSSPGSGRGQRTMAKVWLQSKVS